MPSVLAALRDPRGEDLANTLDWWGLVRDTPAVLSTKTGRLPLTAQARCVDTETMDPAERASYLARLDAVLRTLDAGWALDAGLRAAGIPKDTPEGKVDFHALRVAYVTFIFEEGATPPEARELARHRHPELTLGVYARTRTARLQALVDEVAMTILPEAKCAPGVHAAVGEDMIVAPLQEEGAPWHQPSMLPPLWPGERILAIQRSDLQPSPGAVSHQPRCAGGVS